MRRNLIVDPFFGIRYLREIHFLLALSPEYLPSPSLGILLDQISLVLANVISICVDTHRSLLLCSRRCATSEPITPHEKDKPGDQHEGHRAQKNRADVVSAQRPGRRRAEACCARKRSFVERNQ